MHFTLSYTVFSLFIVRLNQTKFFPPSPEDDKGSLSYPACSY